jgi:hypothetical protein
VGERHCFYNNGHREALARSKKANTRKKTNTKCTNNTNSSEQRKERKARKNDLEWDGGKVAVLKFGGIMELQYLCRHNSDNHKDDGE